MFGIFSTTHFRLAFLFMAGHEATTLPDDKTSLPRVLIAGLPWTIVLADALPAVVVRVWSSAPRGIADLERRARPP